MPIEKRAISLLEMTKDDLQKHLDSYNGLSMEFKNSKSKVYMEKVAPDIVRSEYKMFLLKKGISTIVVEREVPEVEKPSKNPLRCINLVYQVYPIIKWYNNQKLCVKLFAHFTLMAIMFYVGFFLGKI